MESVMRRRNQAGMLKPVQTKTNKKGGIPEVEAEEEGQPLSPWSAMFHRPDFSVHILAIMGCKTSINVELAKAKLPLTLLKHPRFSSVVVGDPNKGEELRWVKTEVDLDKHIIVPDINLNNIESPNKFVEDYIYNLSKTTLDKSRPLWDLHILHVKISEEAEGIGIFWIHHALGDGISLLSLLLALTRKVSDPQALPTIPIQQKRGFHNLNFNPKGLVWRWMYTIWWVLLLFWNTLVDISMFAATAIFLKDSYTPLQGSSGSESNPRRVVYKMVSLNDMKLVKNAMSVTINDVALGITQAGLSCYLNRRYANERNNDGKERKEANILPKNIRLRSILLINLRPSGGIEALANMMENDAEVKWGNALGYVLLPFIIGLREDPLDYIRDAKATVDRKKHSLEALFTMLITKFVMRFFGTKVATNLSGRVQSQATIAFSNVVGPMEEIGFYGHPMAFLAATSYGQPHALMINFQSYVDKMTIVLSVDEATIPDPHRLCDDIIDSLKLVKDAVIERMPSKTDP